MHRQVMTGGVLMIVAWALTYLAVNNGFRGTVKVPRHPSWSRGHDIGPRLGEMGRPALWEARHVVLGDTGYQASEGFFHYEDQADMDPDWYRVDVEQRTEGGSWRVVFQRDLRVEEVPADQSTRPLEEIVRYDAERRRVLFRFGTRGFRYDLPAE